MERERKKEINVDVQREKGEQRVRGREREFTLQGEMEDKEERGGVGGWENRALFEQRHCLIPLQGFKGAPCMCVCMCVCMANKIFNNP